MKKIIAIITLFCLSSCGFEPLYATKNGRSIKKELSHVDVELIPNREGQLLRNMLLQTIDTIDPKASKKYILSIELTSSNIDLGIRRDETAARSQINISAHYVLKDKRTGKIVTSGSTSAEKSYHIDDNPFVYESSLTDAKKRILGVIHRHLVIKISSILHHKLGKKHHET